MIELAQHVELVDIAFYKLNLLNVFYKLNLLSVFYKLNLLNSYQKC
jgi:hypothetical protein